MTTEKTDPSLAVLKQATPMILHCPECGSRHIDSGAFETKLHHTHTCQICGVEWRPAVDPTVGVRFLPGHKNNTATPIADRLRGLTVDVAYFDDHMGLVEKVADLEMELDAEKQAASWRKAAEIAAIRAAISGRGSPIVANQWFKDATVPIDGWVFKSCRFEKCVLVYDGGMFSFQDCATLDCTIKFTGALRNDPRERTNPG